MQAVRLRQDRFAQVDGRRLHYREWGNNDAPAVLILHGLTGHAWEFDGIAEALSGQFHVVVLNQRGHGASDWAPSYRVEDMVEDARAIIESNGLNPVRVIGHSMGGINAWHIAARHPELIDRIAVIDIAPESLESPDRRQGWLERLEEWSTAVYADPEDAVTDYLGGASGDDYPALRQFVYDSIRQRDDGQWMWRFDAGGLKHFIETIGDASEHLNAIRRTSCPVLFIRAADSWATEPTSMNTIEQTSPNARWVEIPDSGHDVHLDQPDRLINELNNFLGNE